MAIQVISTRKLREGKWLVTYNKTCSCGCTTTRHLYVIRQAKEPTTKQILNELKD